MLSLPPKAIELLDGTNLGHLATLMPNGSPQVTPVWVDHDDEFVLINTAIGRVKQRNITRDPRVALSLTDSADPFTKVQIRGRVVAQVTQGASEHINKLSHKYMGRDYPLRPQETRVILKLKAERVSS
jgi:PPOX class probable F420-dependent enzyme